MCQISYKSENKVKELRKPMTVYKVIEQRTGIVSVMRSFYMTHNVIRLGKMPNACSLEKFRKAIAKAALGDDGLIQLTNEGFHAYVTLDIARMEMRNRGSDAARGWNAVILECEIPAWSGVIYGFDGRTVVTNRIKYVRTVV